MEAQQALKIAEIGLDKLLAGNQENLIKLRNQLYYTDKLEISDLNSAGFYVDFRFKEGNKGKNAVIPSEFHIGDVHVSSVHPFEEAIVDYILFVENGLLKTLEVIFIDVPENYDITGAKVTYIDIPRKLPF